MVAFEKPLYLLLFLFIIIFQYNDTDTYNFRVLVCVPRLPIINFFFIEILVKSCFDLLSNIGEITCNDF
jgi:hypothetical protein